MCWSRHPGTEVIRPGQRLDARCRRGQPVAATSKAAASRGGNAVAAIDLNTGVVAVIVGSNGLISRTMDKGNTWVTIQSNTKAALNAIDVISDGSSAGIGWTVGANGAILRTTDGGATWTSQIWSDPSISSATVTFSAVSTADGQSAWAVGQQTNCTGACAVVIYTSDSGTTWTRQETGATTFEFRCCD